MAPRQTALMAEIWPDAPLRSQAEDQFDRVPYAVHAARLISATHTWDESVVFGLTGAWGSGKTSMLAMITEELRQRHKPWRVERFTPWATSDVTGLLADFYATLIAALPPDRAKQARQAVGTLAEATAPAANAVPYGGGAIANVVRMGGGALKRQVSLDRAIDDARVAFRALNMPLLVVVDDVDRLQRDELLALLKVVRLLGRFPGVHYLLAYDDSTVFATLGGASDAGSNAGTVQRFLEKIVQYPLVVPALTTRQLLERVQSGIQQILVAADRTQLGPDDRIEELGQVFVSLLSTPRAVDRYLAQLRHHLPLLAEREIHTADVVVLTLLRSAFPTLYNQLPRWRDELTSGHTGELDTSAPDIKMVSFKTELLLGSVPQAEHASADRLMRDLFPALPTNGVRFTQRPRPCAVSDANYFDRYFAMSIPEHDVADAEVEALVRAARGDGGAALVSELTQGNRHRTGLVLDKASAFTESMGVDDELRLALLGGLLSTLRGWPEDGLFVSPRRTIISWSVDLMLGVSDEVPVEDLASTLERADQLADRAEVVERVARREGDLPDWFSEVAAHIGQLCAVELVEHIAQKDGAPLDGPLGWYITVLDRLGQGELTRTMLAEGLTLGRFGIADVAARFIQVNRDHGDGVLRIDDLRAEEFDALVPEVDDPWFTKPLHGVDTADTGWSNRRSAAEGRFRRASS